MFKDLIQELKALKKSNNTTNIQNDDNITVVVADNNLDKIQKPEKDDRHSDETIKWLQAIFNGITDKKSNNNIMLSGSEIDNLKKEKVKHNKLVNASSWLDKTFMHDAKLEGIKKKYAEGKLSDADYDQALVEVENTQKEKVYTKTKELRTSIQDKSYNLVGDLVDNNPFVMGAIDMLGKTKIGHNLKSKVFGEQDEDIDGFINSIGGEDNVERKVTYQDKRDSVHAVVDQFTQDDLKKLETERKSAVFARDSFMDLGMHDKADVQSEQIQKFDDKIKEILFDWDIFFSDVDAVEGGILKLKSIAERLEGDIEYYKNKGEAHMVSKTKEELQKANEDQDKELGRLSQITTKEEYTNFAERNDYTKEYQSNSGDFGNRLEDKADDKVQTDQYKALKGIDSKMAKFIKQANGGSTGYDKISKNGTASTSDSSGGLGILGMMGGKSVGDTLGKAKSKVKSSGGGIIKGIGSIGASVGSSLLAGGAGSAIMGGASGAVAGVGAGTLGAIGGAVAGGGTGLYSAYKFAKGEDSSNWASNGVDSLLFGKNDTIGGWLHDKTNKEQTKDRLDKKYKKDISDKMKTSFIQKYGKDKGTMLYSKWKSGDISLQKQNAMGLNGSIIDNADTILDGNKSIKLDDVSNNQDRLKQSTNMANTAIKQEVQKVERVKENQKAVVLAVGGNNKQTQEAPKPTNGNFTNNRSDTSNHIYDDIIRNIATSSLSFSL